MISFLATSKVVVGKCFLSKIREGHVRPVKANRMQRLMSWLHDHYSPGVLQSVALALVAAAFLFAAGYFQSVAADKRVAADDVTAAELLQQARDNREVLSETFPGFRSKLTVRFEGQIYRGICSFRLPGNLQVTMQDDEVPPGITATVHSMLMHRAPSSRTSPQAARYGQVDESPLGREILLSDRHESAYRIRGRQIIQVDRRLSDPRFVLTVLETQATESGRYLPRHVFAVRFDPGTGAVREAWTYISEFQEVEGEYLPKSRQVIRTDQGQTTALLIEWSDIEFLEPESAR